MQYIRLTKPVEEAAIAAYEAGHYVEAIQLLHGFIENQARSYLMLVGSIKFGSVQSETWDIADEMSLHQVLKCLFVLNQITLDEYRMFNKLNSMRNKVVHQYFSEPYDELYVGVPKTSFEQVFRDSLENAYFFTTKCEDIVG